MILLNRLFNCSQLRLLKPIIQRQSIPLRGKTESSIPKWVPKKYKQKLETRKAEIESKWIPVYKNPFIIPLSFLVKFKIYHSIFTVGATVFAVVNYYDDNIDGIALTAFVGILFFALALLVGYSILYQRLVGLIYLSKTKDIARLAHLDFWGKRIECNVPVSQIIPLSDTNQKLNSFHLKIAQRDSKQIFYINLVPGSILDPEAFQFLFCYLPPFANNLEKLKKQTLDNQSNPGGETMLPFNSSSDESKKNKFNG